MTTPPVHHAVVAGAGTMGVGIAYVLAAAGIRTTVVEPDGARAGAARRELAAAAEDGAARGRLTPAEVFALDDRLAWVATVEAVAPGADLAVETVPERLDLKRSVLAQLEARRPALLASNTSSLSIDDLAAGLRSPGLFLGMHFFNPVWSLPLVELVRGSATSPGALKAARGVVATIGKQAVVVDDVPGFATSRLDLVAALEAMRMFESGVASAEDIDRAVVLAYRHPVGPLRLSDIVGLDVRLDIAEVLAASLGPRFSPPQVLRDKVAAGELGRKAGRGFFAW